MTDRRFAILIAASQFPEEPKLPTLRAPDKDVVGLHEVLTSPELGGFTEVVVLKNEASHVIHRKILTLLRNADKNDLVLIYYSGHGKLDRAGRLYLTTSDTTVDALEATSVSALRIRESVENTSCNRVILILDCCFSGAVGKIFARGTVDEQLQMVSGGRGTFVMTASTAEQIAQEREEDDYGLFTKHVIQGIRTGAADLDEDGNVSMDELYRYVHRQMLDEGAQEPMKWDVNVRGDLVIARTGKSPREERRKLIRERLRSLFEQGSISPRVFGEAWTLNNKDVVEDSEQPRHAVLAQLLNPQVSAGEFLDAWHDAVPVAPPPVPAPVVVEPLETAKREAEQRARDEEEKRLRLIAEQKAQQEAALKAKQDAEAQEKAKATAAAEKARREAETAKKAQAETERKAKDAEAAKKLAAGLADAKAKSSQSVKKPTSKQEKWGYALTVVLGLGMLGVLIWVATLIPWGTKIGFGNYSVSLGFLVIAAIWLYTAFKK